MNLELRRAFFEDLARAEDAARQTTLSLFEDGVPQGMAKRESLQVIPDALHSAEQRAALADFVVDRVHTALHSALVAIDGGSASAEVGRLHLVDEHGVSLGEGLHELFVDYLFETSRMV